MEKQTQQLGLMGLITIIVGSIIGGGIFDIAQILSAKASLGALIISWLISGIGLLSIALTFKTLNSTRPDLTAGIYSYALEGFGQYIGFNSAWGYWVSTAIGNVVFAIMLNDALGLFFPRLLEHGWPTIIFASCMTWTFTLIISFGVRLASRINTVSTFIKLAALLVIIALLFIFADYKMLDFDFWGKESHLGSLSTQVNSTMLITLWFFLGLESAVIISKRARNPSDVGKATVIGLLICLALCASVSILSFGFMTQAELAGLEDPSVAFVLEKGVGKWAHPFVNISVIIAVAGAWLVWTLLSAELPAEAAKDGVMPAFFARYNKHNAPISALLITSGFIQLFLLVAIKAENIYLLTVDITGIMILPTYILSAMFLIKASLKRIIYPNNPVKRFIGTVIGTIASLYCLWIIYAGNAHLLLLSSVVYTVGIVVYRLAHQKEVKEGKQIFTISDKYLAWLFVVISIVSILLYSQNLIKA